MHFDSRSKLPMMVEYKTVGEEGSVNNEVRYFRWVDFGGIKFPTIQDSYRNGKQSSRVSFDTVTFKASDKVGKAEILAKLPDSAGGGEATIAVEVKAN